MSVLPREKILQSQREWAETMGLKPDAQGYLDRFEDNLFRGSLSAQAQAGLNRGNGSELSGKDGEKAKFSALHSSSALAVNVFDHFMESDRTPLSRALGLDGDIESLAFEEKFPTGLRGIPPNLDVVLRLAGGEMVGIESKFTEWMQPASSPPIFRESYFPKGGGLWANLGLPQCQALASAIHDRGERFHYLGVNQLLKHALGLANNAPGSFRLFYLFYDYPGEAAVKHREEITRFAGKVDDKLGFRAISYQALFASLKQSDNLDAGYRDYLASRYFTEATIVDGA